MLQAYCDCSRKGNDAAVVAIVVTSKYFIDYECKPVYDTRTSEHGELLAVILAMELVNKNFDVPQKVKIISDCKAVVQHLRFHLKAKWVPRDRKYYDDWVHLMELCEGHNVSIEHTQAHRDIRSYNTVCDIAARLTL